MTQRHAHGYDYLIDNTQHKHTQHTLMCTHLNINECVEFLRVVSKAGCLSNMSRPYVLFVCVGDDTHHIIVAMLEACFSRALHAVVVLIKTSDKQHFV